MVEDILRFMSVQEIGRIFSLREVYQRVTARVSPAETAAGDHFELIKQGNLRAELHFKEPLANTVNLIVSAEFQNVIEIDGNRNVLLDYTN